MNKLEHNIVKIIGGLGWALVVFGALFTIWAFTLALESSKTQLEGIWIVFFVTLIFCSIAAGLFFVVLKIIIETLNRIEENTSK